MMGINGPGNQINHRLVRRQVAFRRARQNDGPGDDKFRVVLHHLPQLALRKVPAVLRRGPVEHLVADKDAELLFHLEARLRDRAGDRHQGAGKETFGRERAHECLYVRCQAEGDVLGVEEKRLAGMHGRNEFGGPDVAGGPRNGDLVGIAIAHVHDIRHEGHGGVLVGELTTE